MRALCVGLLGCLFLNACGTNTLVPTLTSAISIETVAKLKVGQTRAEIEAITHQRPAPFSYPTRPEARFQAWPFFQGRDQMCLIVTYDVHDIAIDVSPHLKDRGPFAAPLPGGC